jgi:hypothetical protein
MSHTIELVALVVLSIVDILTVMFLLPTIYKFNDNNSFCACIYSTSSYVMGCK